VICCCIAQGSIEIVFDQNVAVTAQQFAASEPLEEPIEVLPGAVPSQQST
jgi:hypothetical protein